MSDPDREIAKKVLGNVCRNCIYYGECPDFLERLLKPEALKEYENIDEKEGCGFFELSDDAKAKLNDKGYYYSHKLKRWVKAKVLEPEGYLFSIDVSKADNWLSYIITVFKGLHEGGIDLERCSTEIVGVPTEINGIKLNKNDGLIKTKDGKRYLLRYNENTMCVDVYLVEGGGSKDEQK